MTQIVQMCNAFAQNGSEVTLIVTNRKTDIIESPESFFGVPLNFEVVRIPVPDVAGISPRIPVIFHPYVFLIQRLVFAYRSARYIRKNPCSYIYGRDEGILLFLSKFSHAQVVWESHEAKFSKIAQRLFRVIRHAIVISEGIKDFYIAHGVKSEKLFIAHDAVDNRFFAPHITKEEARMKLGVETHKPLVLYIGELDAWKGVGTLLLSATESDPFTIGVIGGKEQEVEKLKEIYPHVIFFGRRPYRELPLYQQAADFLVIPNTAKNELSNTYTSPLKLFAYMTSLKPILASRIPSIQNIVSDDDVFFFNPDDAVDLHSTIVKAIESEMVSKEKARHAYEKSTQFTWAKRAESILQFIKK